MAKKAPVKKTKRRLKRSIRRSLAAVLMVTAIAVAAIPVPENFAVDGDTTPGTGGTTVPDQDKEVHEEAVKKHFIYDIADAKLDSGDIATWADANLNKFIDKTTGELDEDLIWDRYVEDANSATDTGKDPNPATYASMVIRDVDGVATLSWQFMYYVRNIQGSSLGNGPRGVICKYNGEYMAENVDLPMVLNTKYYTVEQDVFNNFFDGKRPDGSELDGGTGQNWGQSGAYVDCRPDYPYEYNYTDYTSNSFVNDATKYFFETYFAADLENQRQIYKRYDESVTSGNPDESLKNSTLTMRPMDINDPSLQRQFYCEHDKILKQQAAPYTLVAVQNQRPQDDKGGIVYVAKGGQPGINHFNDDNGYLVEYRANYLICGIGASAFKENDRIQNLELPTMISFIGDNAFEGASLIKEITIANASFIGNQAFKNCGSLVKADIREGANTLGAECFYHTALTEVKLPSTIRNIGYGAFASCSKLTSIDLNSISQGCIIGDFAFYECSALNNVQMKNAQIASIGKGAFACTGGAELDFVFPSDMASFDGNKTNTIGDFMFAGRSNLRSVEFPRNYGRTEKTKVSLPDNMFHECVSMSYVVFPADSDQYACGYVSYDGEKLFRDVANSKFFVRGPKMKNPVDAAEPRTSTWSAKMAIKGNPIPYLYVENGKEYYEVSNGWYLYCVDEEGVITSCTLTPDARENHMAEIKREGIDLDILPVVGTRKVVSIATDCFSDEDLNNNVVSLSIPDDSLTQINAEVFKGWPRLAKVSIGDSVGEIGDRAFADCNKLIDVTFHSPRDGYNNFKVGQDAFKTGSEELTFHGDIVKGYAPYDWAVDKDNLIDSVTGMRVCYKSLAPSYLTVMYDADTGLVTLLDYPKYDKVDELIDQAHEDEYTSLGYQSYGEMMEEINYFTFSASTYDSMRESFKQSWNNAQTKEDEEAVYASELYGPWVNPDFCKTFTDGGTSPDPDAGGGDGARNNLADFLFEPLVVEAASGNTPLAFYEEDNRHPNKHYSVIGNLESGNTYRGLTQEELGVVNSAKNVIVPEGVESIDVNRYLTGSDANKLNAGKYLSISKLGRESYTMYTSTNGEADDETRVKPGLFSGFYDDKAGDVKEIFKRGNDRIESITLNSVRYLPDYAFDSCENLKRVELGPNCSDIGTAPFRGCYNLTVVGENDYYKAPNGIVYSVNEDGSLTIEECLAARGRVIGKALIPDENDGDISNVSAIKPGAFQDCDYISTIDLSGTAGLTVIPKDCFRNDSTLANCGQLSSVTLPRSVNEIQEGAFYNALMLNDLTIPGLEVFISAEAFEVNDDKDNPKAVTKVRTYEDSSARRYVETYGETNKFNLQWVDIGNQWRVTYFDADGVMIPDLVDQDGNPIDNPQYVPDGEYAKLPTDPVKEGWTFEEWLGTNNTKVSDRIHGDTNFIAQGHNDDGSVGGRFVVEFYDGLDGKMLAGLGAEKDGKYYVDAGMSFDDLGYQAPTFPAHDNAANPRWSENWTTATKVTSNLTIVALYSSTGGNGNNGNTNSSNNSTNNGSNNNTTSSKKSSSTSSTSSSTSSSSTSTSSTTSDGQAVAMYTLLVQSGSGSGSYAQGATVVISAYPPAEGMVFSNWTTESNGVTMMPGNSSPVATFVMPGNNVTITANYVPGTAAGGAAPGNTVGTTTTTTPDGNTTVDITKPGISNKDLATANVNGSTDNFIVKISETDAATQAVAAALTNKYTSLENILYYAMDITLWDATGTYQLTGDQIAGLSVDITIPIPDALVAYGGNNMAGAVVNGDQLENLNESFTTINGVPCVRFTATHFSPYTIYVDTGNLTEGMLDVTPKTGDPIHPKWFLSLGLACLSVILFMKKDKKVKVKTA